MFRLLVLNPAILRSGELAVLTCLGVAAFGG